MRSVPLLLAAVASLASATNIIRQAPKTTTPPTLTSLSSSSSSQTTLPSTLTLNPASCFETSLHPTTTCTRPRGLPLTCLPTFSTHISCKPSNNCFGSRAGIIDCVPRNDTVAPAGIAFAVIVPVIITIIATVLIVQRLKEKKRRREAADDRVRGVHMGMKGSRNVEVVFVERREGDEFPLVGDGEGGWQWDVPPAYEEGERRVPVVVLNGEALSRMDR